MDRRHFIMSKILGNYVQDGASTEELCWQAQRIGTIDMALLEEEFKNRKLKNVYLPFTALKYFAQIEDTRRATMRSLNGFHSSPYYRG